MMSRITKAIVWGGEKLSSLFQQSPYHQAILSLQAAEKAAKARGQKPEESLTCRKAEQAVRAFEKGGEFGPK